VRRVVVVSADDTGICRARAKTDRLDARTLARLLWAGELDAVWMPDERCRVMRRRLARREQLVRSRSRSKNEIHAVLMRRLKGKPPVSDLFGVKGRKWLRELELPVEEAETIESAMRHVEFLDSEIAEVERLIAREALRSADARRLMTVPGVNVICAATFLAAIGDIRRFRSYAHQQPSLTAKKLRLLEITAGAPTLRGKPTGVWATRERMRHAERELAQQAEASYARMVRDWQAARPATETTAEPAGVGASVTPGRAQRPSKGNVARQTTSP
jgi:hypothetical protein